VRGVGGAKCAPPPARTGQREMASGTLLFIQLPFLWLWGRAIVCWRAA
jgi:hypothetical protein